MNTADDDRNFSVVQGDGDQCRDREIGADAGDKYSPRPGLFLPDKVADFFSATVGDVNPDFGVDDGHLVGDVVGGIIFKTEEFIQAMPDLGRIETEEVQIIVLV